MNLARTLNILKDLIAFDTTSRNSNLAIIEYIQRLLDELKIPHELTFNHEKSKANIFATIGDPSRSGLVLSGHTDVVPVDGQDWASDPFTLEQRDNKLFGRGTCDMKGFIAVCLAMAESFKLADLPIPIHFAFSYDEEVGCIGVHELIAELSKREVKPLACVVGEPTNMQIVSAHKGMLDKVCTITGCAGHSSLPDQGVNAIASAAKLISFLHQLSEEIKQNGPFDARFTPPHSTIHVGKIEGGVAVNIIPEHCQFEFEIRNIPTQDPVDIAAKLERFAAEKVLPEMQVVSTKSAIQWHINSVFPGLDTTDDAELIKWMRRALNSKNRLGAVSYGTEAGLFSEIGVQTIVCGPGSIEQAHRPDEFVTLSELEACLDFMHASIRHLQNGDLPFA